MGRHLLLAVLAVQLVCTLQAPLSNPNTNPMMEMMMNMMTQGGQDGRAGPYGYDRTDELEVDISADLREYTQRYHYDEDDDQEPLVGLLKEYNDNSERMVTKYKVEQNEDMVTKAIIYDIFTNGDGPSEFAKNYLLKDIHSDMNRMDGRRQLAGMLLRHLMANPRGNNNDVAMQLLYHLISMLDEHGKTLMRMNILNMMSMYSSDHEALQILMSLMNYIMSDEVAFRMESTDALLLLLQHYMSMQFYDKDRLAMSLLLLKDLSSRDDYQGEGILRSFVATMILAGNRPGDIPENEQWKFYPPGPCRVQDRFSNDINSTDCPNGLTCTVSPVTFNFNGKNQRYSMCAYPLENFVFHACEVTDPDGNVDRRPSCLPNVLCNFGPFTISSGGKQYRAKFCADIANNTANYSSIYPVVGKACALEDENGLRSMQRRCPHSMKCAGGKYPVMIDNTRYYASMCQPNGHHSTNNNNGQSHSNDGHRFMDTMMNSMMGFGDDIASMRLMALTGNSNMGGLDMAGILESSFGSSSSSSSSSSTGHDMPNNRSSGELNEDFLKFVMATVLQDQQRGGIETEDERAMDEHYDKEYDVKLFRIMRYLVHSMAADKPQLVEFVKLIMEKHQLGLLEDVDRIMMHGMIRYLLALWYHQQRDAQSQQMIMREGRAGGSDYDEDFIRHNMAHESIEDNLEDLWKINYDSELERRQQQMNNPLEIMRYMQQRSGGGNVDDIYELMKHYMDRERMEDLNRYQYQQQGQGYGFNDMMRNLQRMTEHDDQHSDMEELIRRMSSSSSTGGTRNQELQLLMMLLQGNDH